MKIQYMSDLHLEILENDEYFQENMIPVTGDVLILAGDITKLNKYYYKNEIFDYFSKNWDLTIMVPGNHEYYNNSDLSLIDLTTLNRKIRDNVLLVNNDVVVHKGINFICTTLWSHIPTSKIQAILSGLNDFKAIMNKNGLLSIDKYNEMHIECKSFLFDSLTKFKGEKNVVITHHAPSQLVNVEKYRHSNINSAFVVEMFDYIHDFDIDHWIYGHTHSNLDNEINGTKVVSNQFGYVFRRDDDLFDSSKYFEI